MYVLLLRICVELVFVHTTPCERVLLLLLFILIFIVVFVTFVVAVVCTQFFFSCCLVFVCLVSVCVGVFRLCRALLYVSVSLSFA